MTHQQLWVPFMHSPKLVAFADAQFGLGRDALRDRLLGCVDDSPFSLLDWMESLKLLGHWLDGRGLTMDLDEQLGYLSCAAEAAGSDAQLAHLPALVSEMLDSYGCERAVKKQAGGSEVEAASCRFEVES